MNNKGFTRIELLIVILILGVLSVIAIPIYKEYVNKAIYSEGRSLLISLSDAQRIYYSEFGTFHEIPTPVSSDSALNIDAENNKIFKTYSIKVDNETTPRSYEITVYGQDKDKEISLSLKGEEGNAEISISSEK
jgi:prepilin-type N-terminal cleavage/methylation domain-containing protein